MAIPALTPIRISSLLMDSAQTEKAESRLDFDPKKRSEELRGRAPIQNVSADQVQKRRIFALSEGALPVDLERINGVNDLMSVNYLERGMLAGRSVGRILVRDTTGDLVAYGTGFLISSQLIITNHHVLGSLAEAEKSQIEFNYQMDTSGRPVESEIFGLSPEQFFFTHQDLDFTVVAVQPKSTRGAELTQFGFLPLIAEPGKVLEGEYVSCIEHPGGQYTRGEQCVFLLGPRGRLIPFFKREKQGVQNFERARQLFSGDKYVRQCAALGNDQAPLVELPPSEKFLGPQSKGMGDVGSNGDLWRSLSGEFLKFWTEFLPNTDVKMLAAVLCCRQRRTFDFVPRFLSSPISDWWNGNATLSADFCQANVGHAKFFGKGPHGSRPDFFVEFSASQANSFRRHPSLSYRAGIVPTSRFATTYPLTLNANCRACAVFENSETAARRWDRGQLKGLSDYLEPSVPSGIKQGSP
ncbi:MAG TPA: serine protease [Dongiaceae bacterium]|nr:serine protease [Dongiaceae bacterium]